MLDIVEVIRRTEQGITQPYVCKAQDGELYFVKGKGAGMPSLTKEWLAGCLAETFGLPIPKFAILNVPKSLFDMGRDGLLSDLGHGPVFASKAIANVNEITTNEAAGIPADMKRRIAIFDWWIMNGDRTLSENGGNPNILWDFSINCPFVIDHNLAFDPSVSFSSLEEQHIFGSFLSEIAENPSLQEFWSSQFRKSLRGWGTFCSALPERWSYLDDQLSLLSGFDPAAALATLERFEASDMWKRR